MAVDNKYKILIVNQEFRDDGGGRAEADVLGRAGYSALIADGLDAGLRLAILQDPDLILLRTGAAERDEAAFAEFVEKLRGGSPAAERRASVPIVLHALPVQEKEAKSPSSGKSPRGRAVSALVDEVIDGEIEPLPLVVRIATLLERRKCGLAWPENDWRFQAMFENAAFGIAVFNADGLCLRTNVTLQKMLGFAANELDQKTFAEITHPEDVALDAALNGEICRSERDYYQIEKRYVKKNGEILWGKLTAFVVRGRSAGGIQLAVGLIEDITARKRTEAALIEKEQKYRMLMEHASDAIVIFDERGVIGEVNDKACELWGRHRQEIIGHDGAEFFDASDLAETPFRYDELGDGKTVTAERQVRRKDGALVPVESSTRKGFGDNFISIIRDVSERKRSEQIIHGSRELLSSILRNFPNGSVNVFDRDLRCLLAEGRGLERAGLSSRELVGKTVRELLSAEAADFVMPFYERTFEGEEVGFELPFAEQHYYVRTAPLRNSDNVVYAILVVGQDLTPQKNAEELLRAQVDFTEAITSNLVEGLYAVDTEGRVIFFNPAAEQLLGWPKDEILGRPVHETIHFQKPDGSPFSKNDCKLISVLESRTAIRNYEDAFIRKDGAFVEVYCSSSPMIGAGGELLGAVLAFHDIGELKKTERALMESREHLELAQQIARLGSFEWNLKTQEARSSVELKAIYGVQDTDTFKGRYEDWGRFVHPDDLPLCTEKLRQTYETGTLASEFRIIRPDGKVRWINARGTMFFDAEGKPDRMVGVNMDVTESKYAEEVLRRSEQEYRLLTEYLPQQLWTARTDGLLDYANRQTLDYFGLEHDQVIGENWQKLVHPDDLTDALARWRESLATGRLYEAEFRLRHGVDGEYRWHLARASAMRDAAGEIVRWLGTTTDIDDLRKAEENARKAEEDLRQAQKLESVGRLAGGIAHDFNNMLTAINGYSSLVLRRMQANDPLRQSVAEIKKAGERSAALTQQLLAFSRRQILQPKLLNLDDVILDTTKLLRRLIGEHIKLNIVPNPEVSKIEADPGQLAQVIMNLAINARDAMPNGGCFTIESRNVRLGSDEILRPGFLPPGAYVQLIVSDTGTGMSEEVRQRAFEPFFTTKELGRGTGLGLATVYGIVKQSNGYIEIDSLEKSGASASRQSGTIFRIYFPLVAVDREPDERFSAGPEKVPAGTETILLVEDEAAVRNLTRQILDECGYKVIEAANGVEALSLAVRRRGIDLLLTDVVMPELGGRELAEKMLATNPQMKTLFMSGYTDPQVTGHEAVEFSGNFIQKPFTYDGLAIKVREILQKEAA